MHTWSQRGRVVGVESIDARVVGVDVVMTVIVVAAADDRSVVALIRQRAVAFVPQIHPRHLMPYPPAVHKNTPL